MCQRMHFQRGGAQAPVLCSEHANNWVPVQREPAWKEILSRGDHSRFASWATECG